VRSFVANGKQEVGNSAHPRRLIFIFEAQESVGLEESREGCKDLVVIMIGMLAILKLQLVAHIKELCQALHRLGLRHNNISNPI
jgi:hypothetical protein